jgi:hypothetical protein
VPDAKRCDLISFGELGVSLVCGFGSACRVVNQSCAATWGRSDRGGSQVVLVIVLTLIRNKLL